MRTIELFCGTKSFSKVAEELGHKTLTIDNNKELNPTLCANILDYNKTLFFTQHDILWASPPCTAFSVASISKNWKNGFHISDNAELGLILLDKTIYIIADTRPTFWFIENPRGMMRKFIDTIFKKYNITKYKRITISYCQYGDTRMKPTDIWTNCLDWIPKPICKPKASCHIRSPRGSKTGTQGLKNAKDRGVIPRELFIEIFRSVSL